MSKLIHPTAIISSSAQLHPTVKVGAYAVIGDGVTIGENTTIGSHAIIEGLTRIGTDNQIFPGAAIGLEPQDLKYKGAASWVKIGDRNRIREYVTINRATEAGEATVIGNDNLLMAYSHVGHNTSIGDEVIIANNVAIAGHVCIESQAIISGVLGIHQFVHIGKMAMIGGMTRIVRDVAPYMLVEGNPARVRSLNLVGLKRRNFSQEDIRLLKKAFRLIYRSGLMISEVITELDLLSDKDYIQHLKHFIYQSTSERRGLIPH
ncbi:MAG: acyl-ACP--UDP-N-acetylglucosamine O-acyltransferase [Cyanobacteria bacterium J083]|nr:MAG: acyl-ACP--UDP-N-acetylglucosamine O-acyltransferase [Cyanobacteria bacterium J083]